MDEELQELPSISCSFSKQGTGFVIYIGRPLATKILESMPLSKDAKHSYSVAFDEEHERLYIQKERFFIPRSKI